MIIVSCIPIMSLNSNRSFFDVISQYNTFLMIFAGVLYIQLCIKYFRDKYQNIIYLTLILNIHKHVILKCSSEWTVLCK